MDNKTKAFMTITILLTLVATAAFFLLKPTLSRSHEGAYGSTVDTHLVSSMDPRQQSKSSSKATSTNVTYHDDIVKSEVESRSKTQEKRFDDEKKQSVTNDSHTGLGRTDGTPDANLARAYYQQLGFDDANKTYTRFLSEDKQTYVVNIVDLSIKAQGGSGTVDVLQVDDQGNVSPVNY